MNPTKLIEILRQHAEARANEAKANAHVAGATQYFIAKKDAWDEVLRFCITMQSFVKEDQC